MKILLFDIETSPNLSYTWGAYEQDVVAFKQEWQLLCFAYKWLGEKPVHVHSQRNLSERQLVTKLHAALSAADVLIAHNGDQFDIKKSNAKFVEFGLTPPSPAQTIDTRKVAKRHFAFNSNKLDALGSLLGVGRKMKTGGFDLWLDCMAGKKAAWARMEKYNKQDVLLLERVYLELRPWIKNHPNVADVALRACPKCGSEKLHKRGILSNSSSRFQSYQCMSCGGWSRARLSEPGRREVV